MNDDAERLIARHLDGTATPDETDRLDALLRGNPEARRRFYLAAEQADALRDILSEDKNAALATAATAGPRRGTWMIVGVAAALAIAFIGAVLLGLSSDRPTPVVVEPIAAQPPIRPVEASPVAAPKPVVPETPAPAPTPAPTPSPAPIVPKSEQPVKPTEVPRPLPAPAPAVVRETIAAVAILEKTGGDVRIVSAGQSSPAVAGQKLLSGDGVETGSRGRAVLNLDQGGLLELGSDTLVSRVVAAGVNLDRGFVQADLPASRPRGSLVVATSRARAEAGGTKFSLRTGLDATWMEVDRGRARLTRSEDNASIEIAAGQLGAVGAGFPFVPRGQDAAVDQARVDAAIAKGVEFLRAAHVPAAKKSDELVLLTLLHAGVPESDPQFKRMLTAMLQEPLERTYNVGLQCMILEELDRVKYQYRLQQCAQFLVDNQCKNGQWSYGTPSMFVDSLPVPTEAPREVQTGPNRIRDFSAPKEKPKVTRKLPVKKLRDGPATGDNSNSQYATLGLRACFDAGIELPREVVQAAKDWWIKCQGPDEAPGSGYEGARGWGYHKPGKKDDDDDDKNNMLGSMTAGGVGSLVICDYILGLDWKKNTQARSGLNWLASHFTVTDNPGGKPWRHYYFLYGIERAGVLSATEKFGSHAWYPLGARFLIDAQLANGSWKIEGQQARTNPVWDTCFAILFLKRATKPLRDVATEDRIKKR